MGVPWWMRGAALWALVHGGCAAGAAEPDPSVEAPVSSLASPFTVTPGGAAGTSSDEPTPEAAPPQASADPHREPCTEGQVEACICEDTGTEGQRACAFDASSPSGGYFDACGGCPPPAPEVDPCADGVRGGGETDVDCGGRDCARCDAGMQCESSADCASNACDFTMGRCRASADSSATEPSNAAAGMATGAGGSGAAGSAGTGGSTAGGGAGTAGTGGSTAGGGAGTAGTGGGAGSGGTATAGTGGSGGTTTPPAPPSCTTDPSLCDQLLQCCRTDGICGTGVPGLCF